MTTTNTNAAQDSQVRGTSAAPITEQDDDPTKVPSISDYMQNFQSANKDTQTGLRFKKGFDSKPYQFRYFNFREVGDPSVMEMIANDGFVKVTKKGAIFGRKFADMFEPDAWHDSGTIVGGTLWDSHNHQSIVETTLFCRPIEAKIARQRVEAKHSYEYVSQKSTERKQLAGERKGMANVDKWDVGDDRDGNLWD